MLIHTKTDAIFRLAAVALLAAAFSGCSSDTEFEPAETAPDGVVLRLSTGSPVSRADDRYDGKTDPYAEGEEVINSVSLFFFSEDPRTADNMDEEPFYVHTVPAPLGAVTTADLTVKVPVELIPAFTDDEAYVHVLANLPGTAVDEDKKEIGGRKITWRELMETWVVEDGFTAKGVPGTFVMRGGSMVTLHKEGDRLAWVKGAVMLERLASKTRLWVQIPPAIYLDGQGRTIPYLYDENNRRESEAAYAERVKDIAAEKWEPVPSSGTDSNIRLYFYNIATRGRLDAYTGSPEERDGNDGDGILRYRDVDRRIGSEEAVRLLTRNPASLNAADISSEYPYTHETAYYSYPNTWNSLSPTEKHQTYVLLSMPWERTASKENTGAEYQVCYYKIPVNALVGETDGAQADRLDPNRYYRIKIRLGMLGSKDLGDPLEIDATCEVADWAASDVDVNIKPRRYLVVNQPVWTMNNTSSLEIPFSSSHRVKVEACYVTYFRYDDMAWGTDQNAFEGPAKANVHDKKEFDNWLAAADAQLKKEGDAARGREFEGYLENVPFDGKSGDVLYYKPEYFNDPYIGFTYYLGHEHPKTVKDAIKGFNDGKYTRGDTEYEMPEKDKALWNVYRSRFQLDSVYTCTINHDKSVVSFYHPLIQWEEVRSVRDADDPRKNTGELLYYVPVEHKRQKGNLWDEFSRCEITIKIKHEDWDLNDLYEETIRITQYPAMYVEVSHDYGGLYQSQSNRGNEYIMVNGNKTENGGDDGDATPTYWYETSGWVTYFGSVNNNPNMYVIHTTQLSEENEVMYDLGDPRSLYYNNILSNESFRKDFKYYNMDTEEDGVPQRWSNANITTGLPSVILNTRTGRQDIAYSNSQGPAWWYSREYTAVPNFVYLVQTSTDYSYRNYDMVKSLYPETKPDNEDPDKSTSHADISWTTTHQEWDYVNHKNNLCYYYPTDETTGPGSKENFVAPSFRIASSLGKVSLDYSTGWYDTSREQARRRCATYQEAGRPAGRWRVPTAAEIRYVVQLSADGKIPQLFGNGFFGTERVWDWGSFRWVEVEYDGRQRYAPYWSASGLLGVRAKDNDVKEMAQSDVEENPAVRCVYDDWYWDNIDEQYGRKLGPKETTFYWGDRKKDNVQTQAIMRHAINKKEIVAEDE